MQAETWWKPQREMQTEETNTLWAICLHCNDGFGRYIYLVVEISRDLPREPCLCFPLIVSERTPFIVLHFISTRRRSRGSET